jgi:hypothetical protein
LAQHSLLAQVLPLSCLEIQTAQGLPEAAKTRHVPVFCIALKKRNSSYPLQVRLRQLAPAHQRLSRRPAGARPKRRRPL